MDDADESAAGNSAIAEPSANVSLAKNFHHQFPTAADLCAQIRAVMAAVAGDDEDAAVRSQSPINQFQYPAEIRPKTVKFIQKN